MTDRTAEVSRNTAETDGRAYDIVSGCVVVTGTPLKETLHVKPELQPGAVRHVKFVSETAAQPVALKVSAPFE
jgi:hypothetical protein